MRRFRWDKKYLHWGVTAFLVIAYLLYPLMRIYQRGIFAPLWRFLLKKNKNAEKHVAKLSRGFAVFLAIISLLVILTGLVWMVAPQMYTSIETIIVNSGDYIDKADAWISKFFMNNPEMEATLSGLIGDVSKGIVTWATNNLLPQFKGLLTNVTSGVFSFAKGIYNILIGMIVSIYVLYSRETFSAHCKKILYAVFSLEAAKKILNAVHFTNDVFQSYISGKILDSIIIGLLCYIGCALLGLDYPVLVSFIVGITNIIPFFGPFIGAVPSALIILTASPMHALVFVIFIVILQQFDGNILGPKILGNSIGINGFWVLFSILVGAGLFSFGGMLLGVPVFVVIYTFFRNLTNRKLERSGLPVKTETFIPMDHIDPKTGEVVEITEEIRTARRKRYRKKEGTAKTAVPGDAPDNTAASEKPESEVDASDQR